VSRITDVAEIDGSLPALLLAELIEQHGIERTHQIIDEVLDGFSNIELASHFHDWSNVWARPKQVPPREDWQILGHLMGRGSGKTVGISHWVNDEVEAGRAPLICLIAQDEQSSIQLHVTGPSGLIATSKPWFRPEWRTSDLELIWPNGSRAYVRTPEVPGKIRGLEYHLTWASEIQSWPQATMKEAWMNVQLSTRLGLARIIWDATAKRRHALLTKLLKDATHEVR
jgi:phage terminase large subunit-like protein